MLQIDEISIKYINKFYRENNTFMKAWNAFCYNRLRWLLIVKKNYYEPRWKFVSIRWKLIQVSLINILKIAYLYTGCNIFELLSRFVKVKLNLKKIICSCVFVHRWFVDFQVDDVMNYKSAMSKISFSYWQWNRFNIGTKL